MATSPFSLSHNWKLKWQRNPKYQRPKSYGNSVKENNILKALASVGIIGGAQLSRLFNIDKGKKKKMAYEGKMIRHEILKGDQKIPIFTLGPTGAEMISLAEYEQGYWLEYNMPEVLKRLLFFELYSQFPKAKILAAPAPFLGVIQFKSIFFYVYIVRGDIQDLLMHLKWKPFPERLLIVTESLNHLQPFNIYVPDIKVRVTTDDDLNGEFGNLFYGWKSGSWQKEKKQEPGQKVAHL